MTTTLNLAQASPAVGTASVASSTNDAATIERRRLTDAAQQFEAMFLQEMLKPLRSGTDEDGEKDKDASPGSDTMSSFGTEAVAMAIAKGKGVGIARQIVEKVHLEQMHRGHPQVKKEL